MFLKNVLDVSNWYCNKVLNQNLRSSANFDLTLYYNTNLIRPVHFLKTSGTALLFAKNARAHGNQAEQFFKAAKQKLSNTDPTLSPEDKQKLLLEGLSNICDGMISLRNQNGAITSIVTTSALFGERGDMKMTRLLRKR